MKSRDPEVFAQIIQEKDTQTNAQLSSQLRITIS